MENIEIEKLLKGWIRTQHLICLSNQFIFETVDQTALEKFEHCIVLLGGQIRSITAIGNWPMGPRRSFKILRAIALIPSSNSKSLVIYWAKRGSITTRYHEIT
jgi:phycoerythrin-associated linker protein